MSDFNQPTRKQDAQVPTTTPPSGQQTRETQHGSIERNPDAPAPAPAEPDERDRPAKNGSA